MGHRDDHFDRERADYAGPERRLHEQEPAEVEPVVLTRKLADAIDGVNLTGRHVGERLPLPPQESRMLIAEGWAEPTSIEQRRRPSTEPRADYRPSDDR